MKKILLCLTMIISFIIGLSSCGGFIADESLTIESINYQLLDDGRTMIVINYTDDEIEPEVFYIPKGEEGNGIKNIYQTQSDDGKSTILQIHFTDINKEPVFINMPNAISVSGLTSEKDEDGNTVVKLKFSNGTESDPIVIEKGDKGDAGTSIVEFTTEELEDGSCKLKFRYSDGSIYEYLVPAPEKGDKGEDGKGIDIIQATTENGEYVLNIIYSDGTEQRLNFDMPQEPNKWLTGTTLPKNEDGDDGDFYFDLEGQCIYSKAAGKWITVVSFESYEQEYLVKFDKNAPDATLPFENKEFKVKRGSYFASIGSEIPMPIRAGYEFNGWYTTKTPNQTNGKFTDLTPVFSDLVLYASYTPITYSIEYKLNGGVVDGYNPTHYTIEDEDFILINPTKQGYTFIGWTTPNSNIKKLKLEIANGSINNKIFIANWQEN